MARKVISKKVVLVLNTRDQFINCLKEINSKAREAEKLKLDQEEEIEKVKLKWASKIKPLDKSINEKLEGAYIYAQVHRPELTDNLKVKTVETPAGTCLWRLNPPSVEVDDEEKAIAELKKRDLLNFIRTREEIDKEAILKNKSAVTGLRNLRVKLGDEVFVIKPADVKIEMERGKRKFKRREIK